MYSILQATIGPGDCQESDASSGSPFAGVELDPQSTVVAHNTFNRRMGQAALRFVEGRTTLVSLAPKHVCVCLPLCFKPFILKEVDSVCF